MRRSTRAVAVATAVALALTGCRDGATDRPRAVETRFLERLSAAISSVNAARSRLATDGNAIAKAAGALDDVDDVAIDGDRSAVRSRRPAAAGAMPGASAGARRMNADLRAYVSAVDALEQAPGEGLDATQRAAVAEVAGAGRAELRELRPYATVVAAVWPRYEQLDESQRLWLARSSNGWYRDQHEAAGAYAVMADRKALAADRRSLEAADTRRLAAARTASGVIATARRALASLIGPTTG